VHMGPRRGRGRAGAAPRWVSTPRRGPSRDTARGRPGARAGPRNNARWGQGRASQEPRRGGRKEGEERTGEERGSSHWGSTIGDNRSPESHLGQGEVEERWKIGRGKLMRGKRK
jgi:hypothetical protein